MNILCSMYIQRIFEPPRDKTSKMACAPSEDSDQPGHSSCGQRRLWSDWADTQADLSLRWAHMPFCCFCHEAALLLVIMWWFSLDRFPNLLNLTNCQMPKIVLHGTNVFTTRSLIFSAWSQEISVLLNPKNILDMSKLKYCKRASHLVGKTSTPLCVEKSHLFKVWPQVNYCLRHNKCSLVH